MTWKVILSIEIPFHDLFWNQWWSMDTAILPNPSFMFQFWKTWSDFTRCITLSTLLSQHPQFVVETIFYSRTQDWWLRVSKTPQLVKNAENKYMCIHVHLQKTLNWHKAVPTKGFSPQWLGNFAVAQNIQATLRA